MIIAEYDNGNAHVTLEDDGTRTIETEYDEFDFEYPLNNDVTITKKCDGGCPYCYMGCTPDGKHADIMSAKFLDTIRPGAECAINLNDCSHPQLLKFLGKMRDKGVIVNGTVNQIHFMKYHVMLKQLCNEKLLWGLGVSLQKPNAEFIRVIKEFPNAVIHVINGILSEDDIEILKDNDLKMLILGYKEINRGKSYREDNNSIIEMKQNYLYNNLSKVIKQFKVVSFDNLAIEQLNVRRLLTDKQWESFYQGDEGTGTFFVDLVDGIFAKNSMVEDKTKMYPIMDDIRDMFRIIKKEIA